MGVQNRRRNAEGKEQAVTQEVIATTIAAYLFMGICTVYFAFLIAEELAK